MPLARQRAGIGATTRIRLLRAPPARSPRPAGLVSHRLDNRSIAARHREQVRPRRVDHAGAEATDAALNAFPQPWCVQVPDSGADTGTMLTAVFQSVRGIGSAVMEMHPAVMTETVAESLFASRSGGFLELGVTDAFSSHNDVMIG